MHPVPPDWVLDKALKPQEAEDTRPDKKTLAINKEGGTKKEHESEFFDGDKDVDRDGDKDEKKRKRNGGDGVVEKSVNENNKENEIVGTGTTEGENKNVKKNENENKDSTVVGSTNISPIENESETVIMSADSSESQLHDNDAMEVDGDIQVEVGVKEVEKEVAQEEVVAMDTVQEM